VADKSPTKDIELRAPARPDTSARHEGSYTCDRCGDTRVELNCKVVCLNWGNRLDCSDLSIYPD